MDNKDTWPIVRNPYRKEIRELKQQQAALVAALERAEQTVRNLAANIPPGKDIHQIAMNEAANLRADIAAVAGESE